MKPRRIRSSSRKRARSLRVRAAFLLLALLPSAMALASQPMSPQGAHDTTVGPGGGLTPTTSPTGGLPAAVPLELPPSRDGIGVPVQVRYTASPRVGAAGMSWDIPLSYVRVSTSTMRRKPAADGTYADRSLCCVPVT